MGRVQTVQPPPYRGRRGGLPLLLLLFFVGFCFGMAAEEPFYSQKETLYSTKTGKVIGEVLLSIAPKSATPTNNEWILIIGEQGGKLVEARNETTLWIFNRKTNTDQFKKDLKSKDYPVEVKGIREFLPFCENGIRFSLRDWDELRKQTQVSFFVNASTGEKVTLRLVFYSATSDKKRTNIDDEAKVRIDFEIPDLASYASQTQRSGGGVQGGGGSGGTRGAQDGEVISLTEKIDPEAVAAARLIAHREDSIAQAEAANRDQRVALLNSFITERNLEISLFQEEINVLVADKKTKVNESTIDSLSTIANEMKNRVDYWENGYSDILLTEEAVHDKFSKFRVAHALTAKKIDDLKRQQNPLNNLLDLIKKNPGKSAGVGIGGLILLKIFVKLFKKLTSLIKSKISQSISKAKSNAKKKMTDGSKKMTKRKKKKKDRDNEFDDEFENTDISDLAEI